MAERGEREKKGGLGTVLGECGAFPVWWTWGRSVLPQRGSEAEGAEMKSGFLSWVAAGVGVVELVR